MTDETDVALTNILALFGQGAPQRGHPTSTAIRNVADGPPPTDWTGPGNHGYTVRQGVNRRNNNRLADTDDRLPPTIDEAADRTTNRRTQLNGTRSTYRQGRDSLAPVSNTAVGQQALLAWKANKLGEGTAQVNQSQAEQQRRAAAVRAYAAQLLNNTEQQQGQQTAMVRQALMQSAMQRQAQQMAMQQAAQMATTVPQTITPVVNSTLTGTPTPAPRGNNTTQPGTTVPGNGSGAKIAQVALKELGKPYVWGGGGKTGPTGGGFDCSSLAQYATYQATGVEIPRTTYDQINRGIPVSRADVQPGDLVFSNFSSPGVPEHVQIAIGGGKVVEAPQPGGHVQVSDMPSDVTIKRIVQ